MRSEDGVVFIAVMLTVLVSLTLASAALSYAGDTLILSHYDTKSVQAFNIAEAGVADACDLLWSNYQYRGTVTDQALGSGSYSIKVEDMVSGNVLITSTGRVGAVERTIEVEVRVGLSDAMGHVMFMSGDIDLFGNIHVTGSIASNGNIVSTANLHVEGDVLAGGTFTYDASKTTIDGVIYEGNNPITLPARDSAYYEQFATVVYESSQSFVNLALNEDLILVKGDAYVEGDITGRGTLVATGHLHVTKKTTYSNTSNDLLLLVALGNIYLDDGPKIDAWLYTANDIIVDSKISQIYGGIVGGQMFLSKTSPLFLEIDPQFQQSPPPGAPAIGMEIISWNETE